MKIRVEMQVTPKEFREALGLPDVAGIQKDVINAIQGKLAANMDEFDPVSLFRGFVSQGMVSAGDLQKVIERFANIGSAGLKSKSKGSGTKS
ncbi:MAG: hypothetical protein HKN70_11185 [Gammaproteobacteria bacterium]|nr:hypothetical protein [Gammaproteobacteria bacterium]